MAVLSVDGRDGEGTQWVEENDGLALEGALQVLDQFMLAGKGGDAKRGAKLLDVYESSPRRTEEGVQSFYEKKADLVVDYVSIGNDLYGYEVKTKGERWPNLVVEGRVETTGGMTAEFSARLLLRDERWRIVTIDID